MYNYTVKLNTMTVEHNSLYYNIYSAYPFSKIEVSYNRILDEYINTLLAEMAIVNIELIRGHLYRIHAKYSNDDVEETFYFPDDLIDEQDKFKSIETLNNILINADLPANTTTLDGYKLFSYAQIAEKLKQSSVGTFQAKFDQVRANVVNGTKYLHYFDEILRSIALDKNVNVLQNLLDSPALTGELSDDGLNQLKTSLNELRESEQSNIYIEGNFLDGYEMILDTYYQYFNNPAAGLKDAMGAVYDSNINDSFRLYHHMRPKFKIYFREEDSAELLLLNDIYGYDNIINVEISQEKDAASKTFKITLSNVLGNLTDNELPQYENIANADLAGEQILKSLNIQPGTTVIIVGGNENYSYWNKAYIGSIVELYPGPQLTIVCQSFGAELLHPPSRDITTLTAAKGFTTFGDFARYILSAVPATHFGNMGLKGFNQGFETPWDTIEKDSTLRIFMNNLPFVLGDDRDINVYLPKTYYLTRRATGNWQRKWIIEPDQTAWDCMKELALFKTDWIAKTFNYNEDNYSMMRETVYVGPKAGHYIGNDDDYMKFVTLSTTILPTDVDLKVNNFASWQDDQAVRTGLQGLFEQGSGTLKHFISNANLENVKENKLGKYAKGTEDAIIDEYLMKETVLFANNMNNLRYNVREENPSGEDIPIIGLPSDKYNEVKTHMNQVAKELLNKAAPIIKPTRNTYFVSSGYNLVANNITVNSQFYNKVVLQYPKTEALTLEKAQGGAGFLTTWKNTVFGAGSGIKEQEFNLDDNIKVENIREYVTYQKNIDSDNCEQGTNKMAFALAREVQTFADPGTTFNTQVAYETLSKIAAQYQYVGTGKGTFSIGSWLGEGRNYLFLKKEHQTSWWKGAAIGMYFGGVPGAIVGGIIDGLLDSEKVDTNNFMTASLEDVIDPDAYMPLFSGSIKAIDYAKEIQRKTNNKLTTPQIISLMCMANRRLPEYYTVGRNILAGQSNRMYDGTLTILGNLHIEPYDRIILYDLVNNMYGMIEVRAVVHSYSADGGFLTTITPDLITFVNDRRDIFDSAYLITKAYKRAWTGWNIGVIGLGAASGAAVGAIGGGGAGALIGGVAGGLTAGFSFRDSLNKITAKEARSVLGRHAVGFIPVFKKGAPFTGGIGGYRRSPYRTVDVLSAIAKTQE